MVRYRYGGKDATPRKLVVSKDMLVVRTVKGVSDVASAVKSEEGREIFEQFAELEGHSFPEVNVTILKNKADRKDMAKLQNRARRSLGNEEEVRFAGRVLLDAETGEPVVYTENLFVKFRDDIKAYECRKILKEYGLKEKKDKPKYAKNAYFVSADGRGQEIFRIAEHLLAQEEIEAAHPELIQRRVRRTMLKPTDKQWHLGEMAGIDAHANVEDAWNRLGVRGKGITIAIIDDGVDLVHREFKDSGKVVAPHDILTQLGDPSPRSNDEDHGTMCAGVACAAGKEAPGVAPEAALMPIRLAPGVGSATEAAAFYWAVQHGADVISCSWGPPDGNGRATPLPDSTRYAIDYAIEQGRGGRGCVVVWAAGNGAESVDDDGYASYEPIIAVAACNNQNKRSSFSDFGKAIWCTFPGGDTKPEPERHGLYTTTVKDDYTTDFIGTSAACPGIAGIAALILSANPQLTHREVKAILRFASLRLDETEGTYDAHGRSVYYGYGRPDIVEAVTLALKTKADGLGGDDFLSNESTLEAITFRVDLGKTTRAETKKRLREERILGSGWTFKNVEHSRDAIDALYKGKKKPPTVKEAWELAYRLRDQPYITDVEPSFVFPVPGIDEDLHARIARSISFCVGDSATDGKYEWGLEEAKVPQAWKYSENTRNAKLYGEGVLVGHPDSGYRTHRELEPNRLILTSDKDFIDDDDETVEATENGNHGLGTASVIMSGRNRGNAPYVTGAAPRAKLMPLRVAKKTLFPVPVLVFGGMRRLRRAINHAVDEGCHVISVSLGGIPNNSVREAIEHAVKRGVIVCAAAGNIVGWVTYPGSDEYVIGVAASNIHRKPWQYSCKGSQVDVTAPGELIWRARVNEDGQEVVERSCGTSFSVALTAGIAALWLAHHGRDRLIEAYGEENIATIFKGILISTCNKEHELPNEGFGAGIVDAEKTLQTPLPTSKTTRSRRYARSAPTTLDYIAGLFDDVPREKVRANLRQLLRVERASLDEAVDDVGRELLFHFANDPQLYASFKMSAQPSVEMRATRGRVTNRMQRQLQHRGASERLRAYLR